MNSSDAHSLLRAIDQTISDIDSISGKDALTDSYLANFLVVYISGVYEEIIETMVIDFFKKHSVRQEIVSYARIMIDRSFRNPNSEKLLSLLSVLDNSIWKATIKSMTNERVALDSIVNNKNQIAHGQASTITLSEVKRYYLDSRPLLEALDRLLV